MVGKRWNKSENNKFHLISWIFYINSKLRSLSRILYNENERQVVLLW